MRNPQEEKGFVLTLDATLAVLVVLAALVGVARVGSSPVGSEEYNRLERDRIAEDALRVLSYDGVLQEAQRLMDNGESGKASQILRENLRDLLPDRLQFRVDLGDELEVYPTVETGWSDIYDNLANVSTITSVRPGAGGEGTYDYSDMTDFHVLGVYQGDEARIFMEEIESTDDSGPNWRIENINGAEEQIQDNIDSYDAVFLCDVRDLHQEDDTAPQLLDFSLNNVLVAGQGFLSKAIPKSYRDNFQDIFGVEYSDTSNSNLEENLIFLEKDHYITYNMGDKLPFPDGKQIDVVSVVEDEVIKLGQWESKNVNHDGKPALTYYAPGDRRAVFFGQHYHAFGEELDSRITSDEYDDWIEITKRALYGPAFGFQPVTLHVWRGNEVESS
ncbi:MAG: hypothetical protein ACLFUR_01695 [Candidatus Hadarchaeia archaeon]